MKNSVPPFFPRISFFVFLVPLPSCGRHCLCVNKMGENLESLQRLSALMSANPARILGLHDRGRIAAGLRADLVIVDTQAEWRLDPDTLYSKGKCTPFAGNKLRGKVLMTFNTGKTVYEGGEYNEQHGQIV